jgi:hypothetical protein
MDNVTVVIKCQKYKIFGIFPLDKLLKNRIIPPAQRAGDILKGLTQ